MEHLLPPLLRQQLFLLLLLDFSFIYLAARILLLSLLYFFLNYLIKGVSICSVHGSADIVPFLLNAFGLPFFRCVILLVQYIYDHLLFEFPDQGLLEFRLKSHISSGIVLGRVSFEVVVEL